MKRNKFLLSVLLIIFLFFSFFQLENISAKSPFEIGVGLSYQHSSNNRLNVSGYSVVEVVNVGELEVRKIRRDILTSNIKLRYRLPKTSFELVIPYKYQRESVIKYAEQQQETGEPTEEIKSAHGLGDATLNFQRTFNNEKSNFNLGIKTTTGQESGRQDTDINFGTNHYGLKVGYSHLKRLDPVVIFGSINYFWNIEKENINPGDTLQYSMGLAYALSQNLSINTRLEHSITSSTYQGTNKIIGSGINSSSLYLGTSFANPDGSPLDFTVGIGLSEDSADFSFQINKPYYF